MRFAELDLPGVFRVDLEPRTDERGFFSRLFCAEEFAQAGLCARIVQANNTLTRTAGSVRGIHFQRPPKAETKIVRCVAGAVWDVAVDIRMNSPTFGKWLSLELTAKNRTMIYMPHGIAHGFQTLEPNTELIYFHSEAYSPEYEDAVNPLDSELNIAWPLAISCISERDRNHATLAELKPVSL